MRRWCIDCGGSVATAILEVRLRQMVCDNCLKLRAIGRDYLKLWDELKTAHL